MDLEETSPIQSQPIEDNNGDYVQTEETVSDSEETSVKGRKRTLTEKGQSFQLQKLEKDRIATGAALRKEILKVNSLLKNSFIDITLEQERDILDSHQDRMNDANELFSKELQEEKELDEAYQWFDSHDHEYFQCRTEINKLIQGLEEKPVSDKM